MKKMLKAISGIALAGLLIIGIVSTVFAKSSTEDGVTVDGDFDKIKYKTTADAIADATDWEPLTVEKAAALINAAGGNVQPSQLKIIWQNVIYPSHGGPVSLTFNTTASQAQTLYAFHYDPMGLPKSIDKWSLMPPTAGSAGPSITASFPYLSPSPVALVIYTPSGVVPDDGGGKSPKTGENNVLLFIALAAIAIGSVTAVVAAKNKA